MATDKGKSYHALMGASWKLPESSEDDLIRWANDPNCLDHEKCAEILKERSINVAGRFEARRQELQRNPFDPRTEVSAGEQKIVNTLWLIFIVVPLVLGVIYAILKIVLRM